MATLWVAPVFHYGSKLVRNEVGEPEYAGEYVEKMEEMDVNQSRSFPTSKWRLWVVGGSGRLGFRYGGDGGGVD
ncbi:hypothetical protein PIB30_036509 [Stylosanthes scabra]|uniref:Uncharacterized protein n=1 Tax=Stylosanthes scabra TaxID=79078 RepID=A0ABU6QCZ0_9FABA|nr:hypothetical protein [Stylosanthes scabra]